MVKFRNFVFIALILSAILVISQKNSLSFLKKSCLKDKVSERPFADDFVTYSMIRYFGVYTLFGVKPVTEIDAQYVPPIEEDRRKIYEELSNEEKQATPYDNFIVNSPWGVSTKTQWNAFKKELGKLSLKEHFFIENRYNYKDEGFTSILLVHEPSLIKVLERYHAQFEQETGGNFNAFDKVEELRSGGSKFWDKIFKDKNHYLMGIIFGFGERNSKCFQLEMNGNEAIKDQRMEHPSLDELRNLFKDDVSIEDMCLPTFVSYPVNGVDEIVENYKRERKEIINHLRGKDLTEEVMKLLENGVDSTDQYARKTFLPINPRLREAKKNPRVSPED